jgi:glycosyltransferase involved in cell wall biosynthesis
MKPLVGIESMSPAPEVSVLINCFNGQKFLSTAIESILTQTFSNWEIIFWDNQSTDQSAIIAKRYLGMGLRYFYSPRHTNLGEARELARSEAQGKWIAILDVDDYWLPNNLESKLDGFVSGNVGLIYSRYLVDRRLVGGGSFVMPMRKFLIEGEILPYLSEKNFVGLVSALFRNSALSAVGGFSSLPFSTDYDASLKIAEKWKVRAVDIVSAVYRVHGLNTSTNKRDEMLIERELILENVPHSWRKKAWSAFLVDRALDRCLPLSRIRRLHKKVSYRLVLAYISQRIGVRLLYYASSVRKEHSAFVKRLDLLEDGEQSKKTNRLALF